MTFIFCIYKYTEVMVVTAVSLIYARSSHLPRDGRVTAGDGALLMEAYSFLSSACLPLPLDVSLNGLATGSGIMGKL